MGLMGSVAALRYGLLVGFVRGRCGRPLERIDLQRIVFVGFNHPRLNCDVGVHGFQDLRFGISHGILPLFGANFRRSSINVVLCLYGSC